MVRMTSRKSTRCFSGCNIFTHILFNKCGLLVDLCFKMDMTSNLLCMMMLICTSIVPLDMVVLKFALHDCYVLSNCPK